MRTALALAALLSLCLPSPARAGVPAGTTQQAEAWALYDSAFAQAAAGQDEAALSTLAEIQATFPASGAAVLGGELQRYLEGRRLGAPATPPSAALLMRLLDYRPPAPAPAPSVSGSAEGGKRYATLFEALHDEAPNNGSRAELVLFQTLNGIALGLETCVLGNSCSPQAIAAATVLGGAAGAGLSLLYSSGGVTAGQALAVDSGTGWGAWHAGALTLLAQSNSSQQLANALMVGQVGGAVAGHFAWAGLGLSAGDVSLMNSAGLYAMSAVALTSIAFSASWPGQSWAAALLVAGDAGLVGGYFLSRSFPMSRGRTLVMDAGGLLGGLLGAGVAFLFRLNPAGGGLLGGVGGVALAVQLTRDWDVSSVPLQVGFAPTQHGGGQLVVSSRF
ncbi:MAG: hypothetical protein FJ086_02905 [Deltaproteobacteria bacterium]|nr:hypothetical protein [Deltaproteobacteria bacterium]